MSVVVLGLNHKTAPISLLERLTIGNEQLPKALHQLENAEHVLEGAHPLDLQPHRGLCRRLEVPRRVAGPS